MYSLAGGEVFRRSSVSTLYMLKESVQAQTHTQDDAICAKLNFGSNSIFWLDITLVEHRNVVF